MKLDFLTLYPEAFGLDVSDRSFKIAKLKKTQNGFQLISFGNFELPEGLIVQGEIKNEDALSQQIRDGARSLKLQTPFVAASLPEEKAFLQVVQLPRMKQSEVKQAVVFEAENYIPYSLDTVYLDSEYIPPLKNSLDHVDVLLAALPKTVVDSYVRCFVKAGLTPCVLEIESLATARALVFQGTAQEPLLLLDMGATRTGCAVFAGTSLRFTASLPILASDTAQRNEFIAQIKKYMGYYESHASHQHLTREEKRIKKVLIAGGNANIEGIQEFLQTELQVPVQKGNPWVNVFKKEQKDLPPLPFDQSLQYTTALGLALGGMRQYD